MGRSILLTGCLTILTLFTQVQAQNELEEVQETMEQFIKDNHIQKVENMVHKFCSSKVFLKSLLEKGHDFDPAAFSVQRKDVSVGHDIDVFVKHFSEHQNFTMIMVPINFYKLGIYDTLLFSVLEVSDDWLKMKFPYDDIKKKEVKDAAVEEGSAKEAEKKEKDRLLTKKEI